MVIVKPCCIGDVVQATAIVSAVHQQWPEAACMVATTAACVPVVANQPNVSRVIEVGNVGVRGLAQVRSLVATWRQLRRLHADVAIVPDRSPVLCLVLWATRIPVRVGLDSGGRGRLYTVRVRPVPGVHELEQSANLCRAIGIASLPFPSIVPGATARAEADSALARLGVNKRFALIAPGGGQNAGTHMTGKRWATAGFAALARALLNVDVDVVLIGGPGDRDIAKEIAAQAPAVVDLTGQLSLEAVSALQLRAALFVGNDSGLSHIAAATGCRTLTIFGPTSPTLYAPRGKHVCTLTPQGLSPSAGDGSVRDPFLYPGNWHDAVSIETVTACALRMLAEGLSSMEDS